MITTSKLLITVSLIFIAFSSCKKDIVVPNAEFNNLFGRWTLVSQSGVNASSDVTDMEVEVKENGVYKRFEDGKKTLKMTFEFKEGESVFSTDKVYLLEYSAGRFSKKGIVSDSFEFLGSDTLVLRNECTDCLVSTYVKNN